MCFRLLRVFARLAIIAVALHFPAVVRAQEAAGDGRYIEIADAGESEGSSDQGGDGTDSNSGDDEDDDGGDPGDSKGDGQSDPDESQRNGGHDRFNGPNGALEAVQSNRALPLDDIIAIARHLTTGQIIDTRLHPVKGLLRYELKVLETNSEVRRYIFNARTGELIKVR